MLAIRSVFDRATSLRCAVALAASVALHAGAAVVLAHAPLGSPSGTGALAFLPPLEARLVGAQPPRPEQPAPRSAPVAAEVAAARPPAPETGSQGTQPTPPRGVLEGPVYYLPSQLDSRPALLTRVDPAYPRVAPPDGGYVLLRLLISERGEIERALVAAAEPAGFFEAAAIDAFRAARFSPGMRSGVAVKSQVLLELNFHPLAPNDTARASGGH